jgi:hypothetical protein
MWWGWQSAEPREQQRSGAKPPQGRVGRPWYVVLRAVVASARSGEVVSGSWYLVSGHTCQFNLNQARRRALGHVDSVHRLHNHNRLPPWRTAVSLAQSENDTLQPIAEALWEESSNPVGSRWLRDAPSHTSGIGKGILGCRYSVRERKCRGRGTPDDRKGSAPPFEKMFVYELTNMTASDADRVLSALRIEPQIRWHSSNGVRDSQHATLDDVGRRRVAGVSQSSKEIEAARCGVR